MNNISPFVSDHPIFRWAEVFEQVFLVAQQMFPVRLIGWLDSSTFSSLLLVLALGFACEDCICISKDKPK